MRVNRTSKIVSPQGVMTSRGVGTTSPFPNVCHACWIHYLVSLDFSVYNFKEPLKLTRKWLKPTKGHYKKVKRNVFTLIARPRHDSETNNRPQHIHSSVLVLIPILLILIYFFHVEGLPVLIVVLSIGIASGQDGGVHSYVHGDLWVN